MTTPDLAIVDATVWTGNPATPGLHRTTTVSVTDGAITHVGAARARDRRAETIIDGTSLLVTPGLVDAHAHTAHRLAVGLAQDVPELEWMDRALGPVAASMTTEDAEAASRLALLEAIESGVTTVCEYATEVRTLIEAAHQPAGVRTVAVETVNEVADRPRDGPYELDRDVGAAARRRTTELFEWARTQPLVDAMYGPQALDMVTPETMDAFVDAAREDDRRLHVHVAQGGRERAQVQARYGVDSAVTLLRERGWLDHRLVAAHLHGATPAQRRTLAEAGVSMVGCPSSIGAIDGIVPPLSTYPGTTAIGTDQAPGGAGGHHLLEECRQAWLLAKVDAADPTALPAWDALSLATSGGADALGLGESVGTLEPGKRADIACFRLDKPPLAPATASVAATPIAALVAGGGRISAEHVLVDGSFIRRDGAFTTLDPPAIVEEAQTQATSLIERSSEAWLEAGSTLAEAACDGPFSVWDPPQ